MDGHTMTSKIEFINGHNNILLIAPHGHPKNDMNTGELARRIAKKMGCHAVVNEHYRKPYQDKETKKIYRTNKAGGIVNLNRIDCIRTVGMEAEYLLPIIAIKDRILADNKIAFVIHIHGAADDGDEKKKITNNLPSIFVGWGAPDRHSAEKNVVDDFVNFIGGNKKRPIAIRVEKGGKFSGWANHNLNQLFTGFIDKKYKDDKVQSIQLEIKFTGFRDMDNLDKTADTLSSALRDIAGLKEEEKKEEPLPLPSEGLIGPGTQLPMVIEQSVTTQVSLPAEKKPDDALVEKAYEDLREIFVKHYETARNNAMLDAGKYIIAAFYDGDFQRAKDKKQVVKKKSLNQLIKRLQTQANDAPTKTWIYDAVGLAVDEHEFESFQTYGKISVSHKLKLLTVEEIKDKKLLTQEIVEKNLSVRDLSARIRSLKGSETDLVDLIKDPAKLFSKGYASRYSDESLAGLEPEDRAVLKERISKEAQTLQKYLLQYQSLLDRLDKLKKK